MNMLLKALPCLAAVALTPSTALAVEDGQTINWKGCGISKKAFMKEAAKVYEEKTGIKIKISGGGANAGIEAAYEGKADLGGTCRHCTTTLHEWEDQLVMTVVAWDALTVIVHPDNPVKSLTVDQVAGIFNGQITDWSEVGGEAGPIAVFAREGTKSGVGHMARLIIFDDVDFQYGSDVTLYKSSGPLEAKLEETPNAIGITGVSSAKLRKLKMMPVDGVEPSQENIGGGTYPYSRPLYLAHKTNVSGDAQAFIDWLLSPEGQAVIDSQGTVTLAQGARLAKEYGHWQDTKLVVNFDKLMKQAVASVPTN